MSDFAGSFQSTGGGGGGGGVASVTATAPILSSGGANPDISIGVATSAAFGAVKVDGTTITAAAGVISAAGGGSGAWTLLGTAVVGTGVTGICSLNAGPTALTCSPISGAYHSLVINYTAGSSAAAANDNLVMEINGDSTGSDYSSAFVYTLNGGGPSAANNSGLPQVGGVSAATNFIQGSAGNILIPGYAGAVFAKFFQWHAVTNTSALAVVPIIENGGGSWSPAISAAITSIVLTLATGPNFIAGSSFQIYGIN
jgi:hypothetical protein